MVSGFQFSPVFSAGDKSWRMAVVSRFGAADRAATPQGDLDAAAGSGIMDRRGRRQSTVPLRARPCLGDQRSAALAVGGAAVADIKDQHDQLVVGLRRECASHLPAPAMWMGRPRAGWLAPAVSRLYAYESGGAGVGCGCLTTRK